MFAFYTQPGIIKSSFHNCSIAQFELNVSCHIKIACYLSTVVSPILSEIGLPMQKTNVSISNSKYDLSYLECATFCPSFKPIGSEDSGNPEDSAGIDVSIGVINYTFGIAVYRLAAVLLYPVF